jgi:hypothetical protein
MVPGRRGRRNARWSVPVLGGAGVVSAGTATHYVLASTGNCSYPAPSADGLYVALPPAEYDDAAACGGCSEPCREPRGWGRACAVRLRVDRAVGGQLIQVVPGQDGGVALTRVGSRMRWMRPPVTVTSSGRLQCSGDRSSAGTWRTSARALAMTPTSTSSHGVHLAPSAPLTALTSPFSSATWTRREPP